MRYYTHPAGVRSPGVTSLLSGIGEERLYNWKLKNALEMVRNEGLDLSKDLNNTIRWINESAGIAAYIGTWLHQAAERFLKGHPEANTIPLIPSTLQSEKKTLERLFANLKTFLDTIPGYKTIACEVPIHGTIMGPTGLPAHFSGTGDGVLEISSRIVLLDWKTSKDTYDNQAAQVAAYGYGWNNSPPLTHRIQELWIVNINKQAKGEPFSIEKVAGKRATNALEMFKVALMRYYITSGDWGPILSKDENPVQAIILEEKRKRMEVTNA